jgi:hypothetical protein
MKICPGKPQCRRLRRRASTTAGGATWSGDRFAVVAAPSACLWPTRRLEGARTELHAGAHQMMHCSSLCQTVTFLVRDELASEFAQEGWIS